MPTPVSQQSAQAAHRVNLILWAAMLLASVLYLGVTFVIPAPEEPVDPMVVYILMIIAASMTGLSFALKGRIFSAAGEKSVPALRRAGLLVGLAMCEAAAVLGLVTWVIAGSGWAYFLIGLGLLGILLHFPVQGDTD